MCPLGTWSFRARLGGNHARTCVHAPPLAAAAGRSAPVPVPGLRVRVWILDWVRVPYPAWFFLNQVSRVWVTRSIPAPLSGSEPARQRTRPAIRIRTPPVGQPTVATVGSNHCNGSDRTIATFRWVRTRWPLLERYK